jgi:hypothetical protein
MKFKELVNTKKKHPSSKLKIIISETQLRRVIDTLTEEQIEEKINEHKSLKSYQYGNN